MPLAWVLLTLEAGFPTHTAREPVWSNFLECSQVTDIMSKPIAFIIIYFIEYYFCLGNSSGLY